MMNRCRHRSICLRRDIPDGSKPFTGLASVSKTLKQRILDIDRNLELHAFHPVGKKPYVVMFMAKKESVLRPTDRLVEQFELYKDAVPALPGDWLIDCLNECDMWKRLKTPEKATKKQVELYSQADQRRAEKYQKQITEASQYTARQVSRYVGRGRKHFTLGE
jgi:hypothetical protein